MFSFTSQERQVILFLLTTALVGIGINFALKVNANMERLVKVDSQIVKIDINKASYEDLLNAGGISPGLAKKIIAYRASHGTFNSLEELKEIKGIGANRVEKLEEILFVP